MHARVSADPVPPCHPPIVLVHGLVVSSRYMVPIAERFAPDHRVYAPDLPGFGRSEKPRVVLGVQGLADALAAWLTAIGLGRVVLLGNSLGCQIIADFALRYAERVDRVVFVGPTVDPNARSALRQIWRLALMIPREPISFVPVLVKDYFDAGFRRALHTFRHMLQYRIEKKLPHIRAPTLVIRGSRDPIVSQRWAEEAARLLPNGRLVVIPGAAHVVNYAAPRDLARVVRRFVDPDRDLRRKSEAEQRYGT